MGLWSLAKRGQQIYKRWPRLASGLPLMAHLLSRSEIAFMVDLGLLKLLRKFINISFIFISLFISL